LHDWQQFPSPSGKFKLILPERIKKYQILCILNIQVPQEFNMSAFFLVEKFLPCSDLIKTRNLHEKETYVDVAVAKRMSEQIWRKKTHYYSN
jgi:hypothetical protein